jgi:integrase
MAKVAGLHLRGSRWYVRILIPKDLKEVYGTSRADIALNTSDRQEATFLATLKRAEWMADFEAKRSALNAVPATAITPDMGALLADLVRAQVLANDERVRHDVALLAEMVHIRGEHKRRSRNRLIIPRWDLPEPRIDDLSGATEEERRELAELNAYLDGNAAIALAAGNLKAVLPLVQEHARSLGVTFDAQTPGAREALRLCLQAYRKACHELTLRDTGAVVVTPVVEVKRPAPQQAPKTLRDVFDRWKDSGDKPRKDDTIKAMDRALTQFERQHPKVTLEGITRDMGDAYRAWLRKECKTPKTARDRLTAIKSLLKYAHRDLKWVPHREWEGLDIKAPTTNKRRPWSDAELGKLFGSEVHTAYKLPRDAKAGRDAAYWVPLLGLYTGARLGELCQLTPADVQTVDGIPAITITDEGDGKTVKTEAGKRTIPLHPELIRLGFLNYVQRMKDKRATSLWPRMSLRKDRASDYFGRWFLLLRESVGLPGAGGASFHYFRHTVRPLMRRAGITPATMDRITGHETPGSVGDKTYDGIALWELVPAVEAIRYPFLTLPVVSPDATPSAGPIEATEWAPAGR